MPQNTGKFSWRSREVIQTAKEVLRRWMIGFELTCRCRQKTSSMLSLNFTHLIELGILVDTTMPN